jgi:hypothetical protein
MHIHATFGYSRYVIALSGNELEILTGILDRAALVMGSAYGGKIEVKRDCTPVMDNIEFIPAKTEIVDYVEEPVVDKAIEDPTESEYPSSHDAKILPAPTPLSDLAIKQASSSIDDDIPF